MSDWSSRIVSPRIVVVGIVVPVIFKQIIVALFVLMRKYDLEPLILTVGRETAFLRSQNGGPNVLAYTRILTCIGTGATDEQSIPIEVQIDVIILGPLNRGQNLGVLEPIDVDQSSLEIIESELASGGFYLKVE